LAVLLITHNLGIVAGRADRVAVMYAGRIVEQGTVATLFASPMHPYTRGLLAALPRIDVADVLPQPIPGVIPTPARWPSGCRFHPRCALRVPRCAADVPPLLPVGNQQQAACWVTTQEGGP
jgi:oligopeptide/dipeptide ABC transporter ATP-binding protein